MLELVSIYTWTIAGGVAAAVTLAVLGCWLAARDRAMQTLCMGQGATLGVLLGLGVLTLGHMHDLAAAKPLMFITACSVSTLTFFISERLVHYRSSSQNTYFAFIFVVILALSYLVSALFPGLESHMSQYFFGDLATMSDGDSKTTVLVSGVTLTLFAIFGRRFSNITFEESIFSREYAELHNKSWMTFFLVIILLYISFAVQTVGFLFASICLFLPTSLMNFAPAGGIRGHFIKCSILAAIATASGFLLSLVFTNLPTVPTIAAVGLVIGILVVATNKVSRSIEHA